MHGRYTGGFRPHGTPHIIPDSQWIDLSGDVTEYYAGSAMLWVGNSIGVSALLTDTPVSSSVPHYRTRRAGNVPSQITRTPHRSPTSFHQQPRHPTHLHTSNYFRIGTPYSSHNPLYLHLVCNRQVDLTAQMKSRLLWGQLQHTFR